MENKTGKPQYSVGMQDLMKAKGAFNEMNRTRPQGEKELEWRSFLAGYIIATNKGVLPDAHR